MTDRLTWLVVDNSGDPITDATPSVTMYARDGSVKTPVPTVENVGGGIYAAEPSDDDTATGVVLFIDNGASASPRYTVGISAEFAEPLDAVLLTDEDDDSLWTGDPPEFGLYVDNDGDALPEPSFTAVGGYLFLFQPVDNEDANYRVDPPSGALIDHSSGAFIQQADDGVQTFGITSTTVRQDYFPFFTAEFSATSKPTSTRVTGFIARAAADLSGRLRLKGLSAVSLAATSNVDAYEWCAESICLGAAVRAVKAMTGVNPELVKSLTEDLSLRWELLSKHGAEALGAGATVADSTDEPEGPTSHIDELDLDTGEDDGVNSDVAPVIRRGDML